MGRLGIEGRPHGRRGARPSPVGIVPARSQVERGRALDSAVRSENGNGDRPRGEALGAIAIAVEHPELRRNTRSWLVGEPPREGDTWAARAREPLGAKRENVPI